MAIAAPVAVVVAAALLLHLLLLVLLLLVLLVLHGEGHPLPGELGLLPPQLRRELLAALEARVALRAAVVACRLRGPLRERKGGGRGGGGLRRSGEEAAGAAGRNEGQAVGGKRSKSPGRPWSPPPPPHLGRLLAGEVPVGAADVTPHEREVRAAVLLRAPSVCPVSDGQPAAISVRVGSRVEEHSLWWGGGGGGQRQRPRSWQYAAPFVVGQARAGAVPDAAALADPAGNRGAAVGAVPRLMPWPFALEAERCRVQTERKGWDGMGGFTAEARSKVEEKLGHKHDPAEAGGIKLGYRPWGHSFLRWPNWAQRMHGFCLTSFLQSLDIWPVPPQRKHRIAVSSKSVSKYRGCRSSLCISRDESSAPSSRTKTPTGVLGALASLSSA